MSKLRATLADLSRDERGLSALEKIGILAILISILAFIPPVRSYVGDVYDTLFKNIDEATGEPTAASVAARGILVSIVSIVAFVGSGYLLLYTNLGQRLAFLVTGAATFGWMIIGSFLFVVYAPRGLAPATLEGLNAFQIRIPALALTLASLVLFLMFVAALDRYEHDDPG